jgi:O-antigen ligase
VPDQPIRLNSKPTKQAELQLQLPSEGEFLGFRSFAEPVGVSFVGIAPYWCFAATAFVAAIALKPAPRLQFSLFDCLTLTTFTALLAMLVAWLVQQQDRRH